MKVQKYEIARVIDKLKSIVQKNDQFPALGGILVNDGYLIASNSEITMQVKLEASEGERFIIPMRAFDLIKNLPDGELDISENDKHVVSIRMEKIKNSYDSYPPDQFVFDKKKASDDAVILPGAKLMEALGHVLFAVADKSQNATMCGVYLKKTDDCLNVVALDGHVVAWDKVQLDGDKTLELIIPKNTIRKIISMGIIDDVHMSYDKTSAIFSTDEYVIYTRLINGQYFKFENFFSMGDKSTIVDKKELIGAMTRAKMCMDDDKPAVFQISEKELNISIKDAKTDYSESISTQLEMQDFKIGFNSKLVLETVKSFTCEYITLSFSSPAQPMLVESEDSDMKAIVLPVKLR